MFLRRELPPFLGLRLPFLFPFTGGEKGSSSVVTLEGSSKAALGCKLDGFTSFRFKSTDIAPLIDWTECVEDSSMVVEPSKGGFTFFRFKSADSVVGVAVAG